MDIAQAETVLNRVVSKVEEFAQSLDEDERDVLAALFGLSAVGGAQTEHLPESARFLVNLRIQAWQKEETEDLLASLPTRILAASKTS